MADYLMDELPVPVLILDEEFKISDVNQAAAESGFLKRAGLRGRSFPLLLEASSRQTLKKMLRKSVAGQSSELLVKAGNGLAPHPVMVSIQQRQVSGYVVVLIDIQKQKETETALVEARMEAEIALQTKSKFLANLSHEIRTPMNAIIGFTEVLSKKISDPNSLNFLNSIRTSGQTLVKLINNILDLAKLESGKIEIKVEEEDLQVIFNEIRHIFYRKITDKGLDFIIQADTGLPATVFIDKVRVQQILINLISNAEKFTHIGYIRLHAAFEEKGRSGRGRLVMTVEDTGIGIESGQKDRIFEPFTQNDQQDSTIFGGTGLGLAISKHLCELMGGQIEVNSAPSRGSKFTVRLDNVLIGKAQDPDQVSEDLYGPDGFSRNMDETGTLVHHRVEKSEIISLLIGDAAADDEVLDKISDKIINNDNNKQNNIKLLNMLEEDVMPIWENVSRNRILTEIEEFADMVRDLGEAQEDETLIAWAETLKKQTSEFDMEKFPETLASFPRILEKLIEKIEQN